MILFFDTETTGLPKNWKAPVTDLDNWPRLVQLAYLVYDFDGNLIHSCNEIIKPIGFTIPMDASKVHGITTDIANQRGSKIEEVFELFSIHLKRAKVIVAHNMAYDEKIIGSELIRLGLENTLDSKEKICTMESTVDLCKIDGPYGYKWPKLEELHRFLFNHDFEGAHDAMADIQATAKCFWELVNKNLIKIDNLNEIQNNSNKKTWIQRINATFERNEILNILKSVISLEKTIKITYRNFNNEISERILININFSLEVLDENEIKLYDIDDSYITGFCTLRNEKRTFKIARIIKIDIQAPKDLTKFKNDNIVPVKNLLGETSWKLFSTTKFEEIEIFQSFSDLVEFVDLNNIREWENYFPFDYSGGTRLSEWEGWELKYNFALNISQINKYSLHFQGKEIKSFISLIKPVHEEEDGDEYFAGYEFIQLNRSFAVIVRLDSIPPDDWDDIGSTYLSTVCFIDAFGNLYWENGDRQFNRIENKKVVDLNFDKLITKFDFVVIGNQMWMTNNLNVDQFRNGDQIFESRNNEDWKKAGEEGKPAWCYYDNDPKNGEIYGKLYNWHAVNDPRGLAPLGWFIPSDLDWKNLIEFLGGYKAVHKLRAENTWEYDYDSKNDSGFTALPGGGCDEEGKFYSEECTWNEYEQDINFYQWNQLGSDAHWWSSSEKSQKEALALNMPDNWESFGIYECNKEIGISVRCLNIDYKNVESIQIGNQKWMTENLNVERFRNGDRIREARTNEEWELAGKLKSPAWCYPNNDSCSDRLYNWYAVKDPRGLAPHGVKIPHNSDWKILVEFLGGEKNAGSKMQWIAYNPAIDDFEINENGFDAKASCIRTEWGHFFSSTSIVYWSLTEKSIKEAGYLSIQKEGSKVNLGYTNKNIGYVIRCLME